MNVLCKVSSLEFQELFVFVLFLVYPMLSVCLDCPFLIAPSVFSNVCLRQLFWIKHLACTIKAWLKTVLNFHKNKLIKCLSLYGLGATLICCINGDCFLSIYKLSKMTGEIVIGIISYLDLQLPMQLVRITTNIVSSISTQARWTPYNIM